jgi:hypothetical protein
MGDFGIIVCRMSESDYIKGRLVVVVVVVVVKIARDSKADPNNI